MGDRVALRIAKGVRLALVAALCGCSATDGVVVPLGELAAAPSFVEIDGQTLMLVPYLWRDFQPVAPPNGQPLIAVLKVRGTDGSRLRGNLHVDAAWVIFGDELWHPAVGEEQVASAHDDYSVVARDGPKWGPGVDVDVVVRIRDSSGGSFLLRAAGVRIQRTD